MALRQKWVYHARYYLLTVETQGIDDNDIISTVNERKRGRKENKDNTKKMKTQGI